MNICKGVSVLQLKCRLLTKTIHFKINKKEGSLIVAYCFAIPFRKS